MNEPLKIIVEIIFNRSKILHNDYRELVIKLSRGRWRKQEAEQDRRKKEQKSILSKSDNHYADLKKLKLSTYKEAIKLQQQEKK